MALFDLFQQKKIRPLIAQRFPLAKARQAHELLGKGGLVGKIVLVLQRIIALNQERSNNGMQRGASGRCKRGGYAGGSKRLT